MGFWFSMFVCNLLVPILMIAFGFAMDRHPPKQINNIYGYRTARSSKSQATWDFAQQYCGRLWLKIGAALLPVSIIIQLPFFRSDINTVGIMSVILCTVQCTVLLLSILPVQSALKHNFDAKGVPINKNKKEGYFIMQPFTLRQWQSDDAASIAIAANNKKIAANLRNVFPHPYTFADAQWYVGDCITKEGTEQLTRAIVVDDKAVGSIGIFIQQDVHEKSAELGYWLAEEYWGKGIMTEAVRQICQLAFQQFDILRIYAEPFADNQGSRRVLEKAGFTCEGILRNAVCKGNKVFSSCIYALLKEEIKS